MLLAATCVIAGVPLQALGDETPEVAPSDEVITPAEAAALEEAREPAPEAIDAEDEDEIPSEEPIQFPDDEVKT